MTFLGAIDLFGRFMWNSIDIGMTITATIAPVGAIGKQFLIDIEQPEFAVFVYPAQATVFVAHGTIQLILRLGLRHPHKQAQGDCILNTKQPVTHHHILLNGEDYFNDYQPIEIID